MTDPDYEDWLEGFAMIPFTETELKQIKSGQKTRSDIDRRNLVREILFLRWLASELLKRLQALGEDESKSELTKYAKFALSGPRSPLGPDQ